MMPVCRHEHNVDRPRSCSQAYARMQYAMFRRHPGMDFTTADGEDHLADADRRVAEGLIVYPLRRPLQ